MKNPECDRFKTQDLFNNQDIQTVVNRDKNSIQIKLAFFTFISIIIFLIFLVIKTKNENVKIKLSRKSIDNKIYENNFLEKMKLILDNDEIFLNELMRKHTTYQLGGPAKFFVKPKTINKIIKVIQLCKEYSIDYFILGNGSNLLVSDAGYDGLVINIHESNFSGFKVENIDNNYYRVIVGGGILMRTLAKKLCVLGLSGLEDIIDIPGTIGGGIIMNASAGGKGSLRDHEIRRFPPQHRRRLEL